MFDTSQIDIKAVIDQLSCIGWKKPVKSHGETVYKGGPCPFCGFGDDRFAVFTGGKKPHFYCGIHGSGCGEHGDVIHFVQKIKGYASPGEAIRELRAMGHHIGKEGSDTRPYRAASQPERGQPGQKWQDQGYELVYAAQVCLWSPVGCTALDYLRQRGLDDSTIERCLLGYWPRWVEYKLSDWGLGEEGTFWIRPSILIPSFEGDTLWSINQRITEYTRNEHDMQAQGKTIPRYIKVKGSGNGLFNIDSLQTGKPVFVTEGEFCAMTIEQETGYAAVATGSTTAAHLPRWVAALSLASHILVAFDNDGGKGEAAAQYWTQTIFPEKAFYWPPWEKDVNDMLQGQQDIALWASMGIDLTTCPTFAESSSPVVDQQETRDNDSSLAIDPLNFCSMCSSEVEMFTDDGIPYCQRCYEELSAASDSLEPDAPHVQRCKEDEHVTCDEPEYVIRDKPKYVIRDKPKYVIRDKPEYVIRDEPEYVTCDESEYIIRDESEYVTCDVTPYCQNCYEELSAARDPLEPVASRVRRWDEDEYDI